MTWQARRAPQTDSPPHGLDERWSVGVRLDLVAEAVDVGVYRVVEPVKLLPVAIRRSCPRLQQLPTTNFEKPLTPEQSAPTLFPPFSHAEMPLGENTEPSTSPTFLP